MSTPTIQSQATRDGFSPGRTLRLARWNAVLMLRNRLALTYAVVVPVLPLALLLAGERGEVGAGAAAICSTLLAAALFPVFYNVLAQFVTRRDELVLKRLRTGEVRDAELLVALVLPGAVITLGLAAVAIPLAMLAGQSAPLNPVMFLLGAAVSVVVFAAFALWTAGWTKNAEAAQLTSMPVIVLAVAGQLSVGLPDWAQRWTDLTPGAAMTDLVRTSWFGLPEGSTERSLDLAATWGAAAEPVLVLAAWAVLAGWLAARSMRWEPRV
ncbi:hypothetical protein JK386_03125 [Nocardioides sp. zg-536]|uniref:ABC-2 type transporter transmembrane domain-containing protein n=1 Tax=Nocardioides faecalis TaxID=2803858 RepID=A0A938Y6Q9_9ACTN|nr:ABC transporter permease [Nocardioides faecalis]MBM9458880.1 hypothetical protein [Nocardioides faecalis]QVI60284.1 hypothetical protein KG111_08385 [Nocardioides faecalis]